MIFFRNVIFIICVLFAVSIAHADNHDTEKTIVEKAKEINQKIKKIRNKIAGFVTVT